MNEQEVLNTQIELKLPLGAVNIVLSALSGVGYLIITSGIGVKI